MEDLKSFFDNRPQTWAERLKQLKQEHRVGFTTKTNEVFPRLLTLLLAECEQIF